MNPLEKTENVPQVQGNMMPSQQEFQMLQVIARNAQDSGLYSGVGQQSKIFMVLLAARELGVSPMLALNGGIWNIQGKIEISSRLMNGLIRRAGHSIKIIISNDIVCTLLGTRSDGDSFETSFSMDDAIKAGLAGGNVWKKYPADMLYNRCMSRLARRLFPDVIGNSYVEGELREAKEVEKLEQVECEEISQQKKQECVKISHDIKIDNFKTDTNLTQETKITFDQLTEIMIGYAKTNDTFKENYIKYIKDKWNVTEFEDLPEKAYQPTITAIQRNIESQVKA
jgi:hypothetical protein